MGVLKKVLILDEDDISANRMLKALSCTEFELIKARNILNAVYAITNAFFDLVIADARTVLRFRKDGFDFVKVIRKNSPETQLVVVWDRELEEMDRELPGLGTAACFVKPVEVNVLKDHLRELGLYQTD